MAILNLEPINVLLIEDNPGDIRLIQESLKENKFFAELTVISDGEEAINYLNKNDDYPDIILLDLNLPKKDGREILIEIKNNDALKSIPVVVLTSSSAEEDISKSYQNYANCFISKPVDLDNFIRVIKSIENFWLTIVKLPKN
ncbi:MAG TPA: response regulator [Ignavibacteriaceae bacterium]|nr:response regulator [Ignavibacteriaceae bacterium]